MLCAQKKKDSHKHKKAKDRNQKSDHKQNEPRTSNNSELNKESEDLSCTKDKSSSETNISVGEEGLIQDDELVYPLPSETSDLNQQAVEAGEAFCSELTGEEVTDVSLMVNNLRINQDNTHSQETNLLENPQPLMQTHDVSHRDSNVYPDIKETESINFSTLRNEVKRCMENIVEPSAPLSGYIYKSGSIEECEENISHPIYSSDSVDIPKLLLEDKNILELGAKMELLTPMSEKELSEYYCNNELSQVEKLIAYFVQQETDNTKPKTLDPFYKLLENYLKATNRLQSSKQKIMDLDKQLEKYISHMWTLENDKVVSNFGKCKDGTLIKASEKYIQAKFSQGVFENFKSALCGIKSTLFEVYKTESFNCLRFRLKIERHIQLLLTSCSEFTSLNESSPVSLVQSSSDSYFQLCLNNLKNSIGILFWFQRKQKVEMNSTFLGESRKWLTDLISVLIRTGSWKDHLFILNHILRCPGGVGKWASTFIQFPTSNSSDPFSDPVVNHIMAVLSILLQPIARREDFISEWCTPWDQDEHSWVMIDSDEEDECVSSDLKESDMVLFLNQIPMGNLFRMILGVRNGKLNPNAVTVNHLMKLFSFSYDFIKIIHSGLTVYNIERYKQFSKRLGRLIRYIIQYATDELELFKSAHGEIDQEISDRLQTEYDNFFLKSSKSIYSSRTYGTWQFLAVLPYHRVSKTAILQLYSLLQLSQSENKSTFQVNLSDFEEEFERLPGSEQFYLLSTFTSMAVSRDLTEIDFIKLVVRQLYYIGFLGCLTKDQCYKNVKSLLYNICDKHCFLISELLQIQNEYFSTDKGFDQSLSVYLWLELELPIKTWRPTPQDLQILSSWLSEPIQSVRSELARIILKSMNYGCDSEHLFLPLDTHRLIAHMIFKVNENMPKTQEFNVIKNVSSLMGFEEPKQTLQSWSWNILLKLRLHLLDNSVSSVRNVLQDMNEHLRKIPDLSSFAELKEGVNQKNPIACFIALMTTTIGHSVPLIYNEGFALLNVLIRCNKSEAAIACMEYLTLMFLECPDSLYKSQDFMSVMLQLLNVDYSYLQLPNSLKSFKTTGPVLIALENMIQTQINSCFEYGIDRCSVIELWMRAITKLPLWIEKPGVINLMDCLCKNAFFDKRSSLMVNDILFGLLCESTSPSESKSSLASLVSWMNSNKCNIPTLLPRGFNGDAVWFFLKVVEVEQNMHETSNFLWCELLKELFYTNEKKTNVDSCLKKVCVSLQLPARTSEVLTIYKLCYQILETKLTHPLIIVLWQKFFLLYFYRTPGLLNNGSVGEKFFHGITNQNLLRRLKDRLKETLDCFKDLCKQCNQSDNRGRYFLECSEVIHKFQLWLEETKLHQPHLSSHLFPTEYDLELLETVINHNVEPWMDFVDFYQVQNEIKRCVNAWHELKNRGKKESITKSLSTVQEKSLVERLQDELTQYENCLPPPVVNVQNYVSSATWLKNVSLQPNSLRPSLRPLFRSALVYADHYVQENGKFIGLSCDLQDLVLLLYTTKTSTLTVRKACKGREMMKEGVKISLPCSGPATVTLTFEKSEKDVKNNERFDYCLKNYRDCLQSSLQPVQKFGESVVAIEQAIEQLQAEYLFMSAHTEGEGILSSLKESGISLFYDFINFWSESVMFTPSIAALFEECVDNLGKTFIVNNPAEHETLVNIINDHPRLIDKLEKYIDPNCAPTRDFIEFYSRTKTSRSDIRLVLLSKFDLPGWLTQKQPRFAERSLLITEIGSGLKSYGAKPTEGFDIIKVLNSHLQQLMMYDFPEHYGEILNLLLDGSESQSIPVSTWFTFINSLVPVGIHFVEGKRDGSSFEPGQTLKKLKDSFTHYATNQNLLQLPDIRETILHLANKFKTDRLKHGLHGLYPKYREYVEPIFILCGMLSHSYIAETLKLDLGSLSMKIADQLWPLLRDLYSPWLTPYWAKQAAKWIQELTDDKCVLLPWISSDISLACYCCSIFVDSVRFFLDTLPGTNYILSHIWFFYVTNFAHKQVKDHVLRVVHKNFLKLPWNTFLPSLQDIEMMVKVVEQFIPMAHNFLGSIFVEVKWTDIIKHYESQSDVEALERLHAYMLHLVVKLPCEPSLKQNNEIVLLLTKAKEYSWYLVDSTSYDAALNWFLMSCDPRIVLLDENEKSDQWKLDYLILQILQICAGYKGTSKDLHTSGTTKKIMYIRACNKWLTSANSRFKCKDSVPYRLAITRMLDDIESSLNSTLSDAKKTDEAAMLLSVFLCLFKDDELISVVEETMVNWLSTARCSSLIYGLLRSLALSSVTPTVWGDIVEACLMCYFDSNENASWSEINSRFVMNAAGPSSLQKALFNNGNLLTFNAILLKNFNDMNVTQKKSTVSDLFLCLTISQPSETLEPKLVLMILQICRIAEIVIKHDETEGISILNRLSRQLTGFITDKGNSILSSLGLKRRESFSTSYRLICHIAISGIMTLFKNHYPVHEDKVDEKIMHRLEVAGNKQYQKLSQYVTYAMDEFKKAESVGDLIQIVSHVGQEIFNKKFLK